MGDALVETQTPWIWLEVVDKKNPTTTSFNQKLNHNIQPAQTNNIIKFTEETVFLNTRIHFFCVFDHVYGIEMLHHVLSYLSLK